MLLTDQVDLLRLNMQQIRGERPVLPIMGGARSTQHTYQFKSLLHPARDIATTISYADPAGDKLPSHLRGWNLLAEDGWQQPVTIHLKKLLGMILHTFYLMITDNRLDVSNDLGIG